MTEDYLTVIAKLTVPVDYPGVITTDGLVVTDVAIATGKFAINGNSSFRGGTLSIPDNNLEFVVADKVSFNISGRAIAAIRNHLDRHTAGSCAVGYNGVASLSEPTTSTRPSAGPTRSAGSTGRGPRRWHGCSTPAYSPPATTPFRSSTATSSSSTFVTTSVTSLVSPA